jgi:hypothetical protein
LGAGHVRKRLFSKGEGEVESIKLLESHSLYLILGCSIYLYSLILPGVRTLEIFVGIS